MWAPAQVAGHGEEETDIYVSLGYDNRNTFLFLNCFRVLKVNRVIVRMHSKICYREVQGSVEILSAICEFSTPQKSIECCE